MRLWVTPVPIPNTMVKTQAADDTMLETAWESRWVPVSFFLTRSNEEQIEFRKKDTGTLNETERSEGRI